MEHPTVRTMKLTDLKPSDYNPRADLQPGDPDYENIRTFIDGTRSGKINSRFL